MVSCDQEEIAPTVQKLLFESEKPGYLTSFDKAVLDIG